MKIFRKYTIPTSWIAKFGVQHPRVWREVWLNSDELKVSKTNHELIGVILHVVKRSYDRAKSGRG